VAEGVLVDVASIAVATKYSDGFRLADLQIMLAAVTEGNSWRGQLNANWQLIRLACFCQFSKAMNCEIYVKLKWSWLYERRWSGEIHFSSCEAIAQQQQNKRRTVGWQ
jgi:hypothetical protein